MTREQFIAGYCERSGVTPDDLAGWLVALPCACGEPGCNGWAMVSDNPASIKMHNDCYSPEAREHE